MFNDIWSLGIVLLNLTTGRNPWKAATLSDSTFRAYLNNPAEFLTTVLPISDELNAVLVRMLEIDWRHRMTIPELRVALERVTHFYSEGAVFDASMARCPWEVSADLQASTSGKESYPPQQRSPDWSKESSLVFTHPEAASDSSSSTQYSSCGATWAFDSPTSSDFMSDKFVFERPRTPPPINVPVSPISPCSSDSPRASFFATPRIVEFAPRRPRPAGARKPLTINTNCLEPQYYAKNNSLDSASTGSSVMQTAVDEDPYASSFFLASSKVSMTDSRDAGEISEDKEMTTPSSLWEYSAEDMSRYCSTQSSILERPKPFDNRSTAPSPDTETSTWDDQCQYSPSIYDSITDALPPPRSGSPPKQCHATDTPKGLFLRPIQFRPRPSAAPGPPPSRARERQPVEPFQSFIFHQTPSSPSLETWTAFPPPAAPAPPARAASGPAVDVTRRPPQNTQMRASRPWFLRARLFGTAADPLR